MENNVAPTKQQRLMPWLNLGYLFFLFMPLFFNHDPKSIQIIVTLLSVAVFLPLYFLCFRQKDWRAKLASVVQVALCLIVLPYNYGANTYLIYGVISAAWSFKTRDAILFLLASILLLSAESYYLNFPAVFILGTVIMASILVFYTIYGQQVERSNQHLKLSQQEVQRLAQSAERERIARDLHDMLGHTLSLIVMKSELANRLYERDPEAAKTHVQEVEKIARESLAQVRQAVSGIRLMKLESELANARLALLSADIQLHYQLATIDLKAEVESVLALATREAVTNIIRHADAKRVEIELNVKEKNVHLQISDDGKGGEINEGNGLKGMRERLQALAGTLTVDKSPSGGVRLTLCCPIA